METATQQKKQNEFFGLKDTAQLEALGKSMIKEEKIGEYVLKKASPEEQYRKIKKEIETVLH